MKRSICATVIVANCFRPTKNATLIFHIGALKIKLSGLKIFQMYAFAKSDHLHDEWAIRHIEIRASFLREYVQEWSPSMSTLIISARYIKHVGDTEYRKFLKNVSSIGSTRDWYEYYDSGITNNFSHNNHYLSPSGLIGGWVGRRDGVTHHIIF